MSFFLKFNGQQCETIDFPDQENFDLNYYMAISYLKLGYFSTAIECCDKALMINQFIIERDCHEENAETAKVYNLLGDICYKSNKYSTALQHYCRASDIHKNLNDEKHKLVQEKNDKKLGVVEEEKIIWYGEYHPDIAVSCCNIGKTYETLSEYQKSFEYYNRALEIYLKNDDDAAHRKFISKMNQISEKSGDYFSKLELDYINWQEHINNILSVIEKISENNFLIPEKDTLYSKY